ncbi:hypothetical protein SB48_HM08orf01581 [Heyndrickxia coagulans]|uniref:Uncharacterized protein n=1 Tax=Heyndrickxia coagulans TaxID=1398 RepID=A0AAN0WB37_HEYCO|nr:hypothetical protein SB48_HM08orf01581 [Heyndrickxia coagulans]
MIFQTKVLTAFLSKQKIVKIMMGMHFQKELVQNCQKS